MYFQTTWMGLQQTSCAEPFYFFCLFHTLKPTSFSVVLKNAASLFFSLLWCSRNPSFPSTWGRVDNDRIYLFFFFFGWTVPLRYRLCTATIRNSLWHLIVQNQEELSWEWSGFKQLISPHNGQCVLCSRAWHRDFSAMHDLWLLSAAPVAVCVFPLQARLNAHQRQKL